MMSLYMNRSYFRHLNILIGLVLKLWAAHTYRFDFQVTPRVNWVDISTSGVTYFSWKNPKTKYTEKQH